jgi:hypothetical protein
MTVEIVLEIVLEIMVVIEVRRALGSRFVWSAV